MKKIFFFTLAFSLILRPLISQNVSIEESTAFEEPLEGRLKILQLKNLNTVLLNYSQKTGFTIRVFDPSRKLLAEEKHQPLESSNGKPSKTAQVRNVISVKNDVICFFGDLDENIPVLHRVIINGNTGKIVKKEIIGRLNEFKRSYGYAIVFGGVPSPDFYISQDPESDNYAVALFNSFESDRNKRIELIHYGEDHQEINRAFYNSPNEEFKYLVLVDILVMGDQKVIACATGHNEDKEKSVLLATLEKGSLNISIKRMDFARDAKFTKGLLRYNKHNKLLAFVAIKHVGTKKNVDLYAAMFALFNPDDYSTVFYKDVSLPNINSQYKKIFGEKESFQGIPQNFYINNDGTYTIVFEETTVVSSSKYSYTVLGNMAIAILDEKTNEIQSQLIPKSHQSTGTYGPMYMVNRESNSQTLVNSEQYKSFDYVNGKDGKYIFFNDVIENLSSIEKGKLTTIQGISASDAFICSLKDGGFSRELLFGSPNGNEHNFAMFTVSDYHADSGTYATLKLENDKGKKAKVIWMKL